MGSTLEGAQTVQAELEPAEDFLAARGIESLANHLVIGHDGEPVTLAEALACGPARTSIDSVIKLSQKYGGKDANILADVTEHIEDMGEKAQNTKLPSGTPGAEKK